MPSATERIGNRRAEIWIYIGIAVAGSVFCWLWLRGERAFYFWDTSAFYDRLVYVGDLFHHSPYRGLRRIAGSFREDYNSLYTVPLLPIMAIFGTHRLVFLIADFLVYLLPSALLAGAIGGLIFPTKQREARILTCLTVLAVPTCWYSVLRGYPDAGGAIFIVLAIWIYLRRNALAEVRDALLVGALFGISILFRRHFVYAVISVTAAMCVDIWLRHALDGGEVKAIWKRLRNVAFALLGCGLVITAIAPQFVWRSIRAARHGYPAAYASYQAARIASLGEVVRNQSPLLLPVAIAGWIYLYRSRWAAKVPARLVLLVGLMWFALWVVVVRQESMHYPQVMPLFLGIGVTALVLQLQSVGNRSARRVALIALGGLLVVQTLYFTTPIEPLATWGAQLPSFLQPLLARPLVNEEYTHVVALVDFLRKNTIPEDKIIVVASSGILNPDLLSHAESALYNGKPRLNIVDTPQVDGRDPDPTPDLLNCQVAVIVVPFQYHLVPEHQKVVLALLEPFTQRWPVSHNFEPIHRIDLDSVRGGYISVWRRTRPDSPSIVRDTTERISNLLSSKSLLMRKEASN